MTEVTERVPAATGSQSLERGLAVLALLDQPGAALGVREMARRLELGPAIVQRLLNTLLAHGYVERLEETRTYRIGPRAVGLGAHLLRGDALLSGAREELERLAQAHHLNGFLGAVRQGQLTYLLAVQSPGPIVIRNASGSTAAFHTTAMGQAVLSSMPASQVEALLGPDRLPGLTPRSVTNRADLRRRLEDAAARGWAAVDGENLSGVVSVGVVLRDGGGLPVAAVSVAAPGGGAETITGIAALLLPAARRLSARLGCPPALLPPEIP